MRRLLGPIGIQPSPQKYAPSAIAGRGDFVSNPSNFSREVGEKFSGIPGVAAGAEGEVMWPASDIYAAIACVENVQGEFAHPDNLA